MNYRIGLLSQNNEVQLSAKENAGISIVLKYKNSDVIKTEEIDILLIDIEMYTDEESVQYFLSKIRKKILTVPVILLLRTSQEEIVDFEWFFDDFILFPFRKGELEMRVEKLLKNTVFNENEFLIEIGQLLINLKEYSVCKSGEKIDFTYKEFELLRFMIENSGQTFSRKDLLNKIWGIEYIGGTRTVDVHIRRLRSKLGEDFNSLIETVRNVGYRCVEMKKK